MQNSLLYYRHNSESDSCLNTDKFPRNRDQNTASKGPLRHFGYSMLSQWVSNYLGPVVQSQIKLTVD